MTSPPQFASTTHPFSRPSDDNNPAHRVVLKSTQTASLGLGLASVQSPSQITIGNPRLVLLDDNASPAAVRKDHLSSTQNTTSDPARPAAPFSSRLPCAHPLPTPALVHLRRAHTYHPVLQFLPCHVDSDVDFRMGEGGGRAATQQTEYLGTYPAEVLAARVHLFPGAGCPYAGPSRDDVRMASSLVCLPDPFVPHARSQQQ
ncbi:hypothetical protein FPV67DRAFT_1532134 [Lyophyllum atratum]|nr:hypothetical protein FPV67DRAFT_1532134 [Lyophyllum atratum]